MSGSPTTMIELLLDSFDRYGDAVAIRLDDGGAVRDLSFRTLLEQTRRETRRLAAAGVCRGSVVALLTGDDPRTFVLRWAANTLGAAVVVFPDGHAAPTLTRLLATVRADLLVTTTERSALATDAAREGGVPVLDVEAAPPPADASPVAVAARLGDLASISLTGGSTGVPKGVPRHVVPAPPAEALASWSDTVQLLCTPVAHIGGTVAQVVLAAGGRVVLQPGPFDAGRALDAIARDRVTLIQLLPWLLHRLLDDPALPRTDTSSLRRVNLGSAPASPERITEAVERLGPVVSQTYGSIEATNICDLTAEEVGRSPELRTTVGRPCPGVELSLRDDGGEVAVGQVGEVWVRSRGVMPGYLHDPEQTAAVLHDGWFHTGDLGRLDDAGYLTLVGRSKDVIIGEHANVSPAEVENALLTHPDVVAAGVCGLVVDGVETVVAAVVPRIGAAPGPDVLTAWVVERRGPHLAPTTVHLVDDLPATPTGKIDRPALRLRVAALT